ncbi:hypothetical protein [Kineococcus arenarius]|uniref:hypothetical protein n=1 Tax=Kineococcus sp. SYSU DK007 TaxID=3383128 RepID=UPI003D7C9950
MSQDTDVFGLIAAMEQDVRSLVELVLSKELGPTWLEQSGLTAERIAQIEERKIEEAKRRIGVVVDQSPLRYSQFFELKIIITKQWAFFKPIFGDKKKFEVYLDKLESFRNAPAHGRELLPFERLLVQGITGEIRNIVTLYRSSMDPSGNYYPAIESVRDSLGNEFIPQPHHMGVHTGARLEVGQVIEFHCKAWDPQGRELHWTVERALKGRALLASAVGSEVRMLATVDETHVGEGFQLDIMLTSSGRFHRHQRWDDSASFHYAVNPPVD